MSTVEKEYPGKFDIDTAIANPTPTKTPNHKTEFLFLIKIPHSSVSLQI